MSRGLHCKCQPSLWLGICSDQFPWYTKCPFFTIFFGFINAATLVCFFSFSILNLSQKWPILVRLAGPSKSVSFLVLCLLGLLFAYERGRMLALALALSMPKIRDLLFTFGLSVTVLSC
jgi:hypothetical protein